MGAVTSNSKLVTSNNRAVVSAIDPTRISGIKILHSLSRQLVQTDGTSIVSLNDYSGGTNNGTQATGGSRGLYKINQFGTKPGVLFDGVNDTYTYSDLTLAKNLSGMSMIVQFKRTELLTSYTIFNLLGPIAGGSPTRIIISTNATGISLNVGRPDGTTTLYVLSYPADLLSHVYGCIINLSTSIAKIYFDGALVATVAINGSGNTTNSDGGYQAIGSNGAGSSFGNFVLGNFAYFNTAISETNMILLYDRITRLGYL